MKPLNEILGYIGNPEAENLSYESQKELENSIGLCLFNYDNWLRYKIDNLHNTSFSERLNLFKEWWLQQDQTRKIKE